MGAYDNLEEWMAKNMGPYLGAPSLTYRDTVRSELAAMIAAVEGGPVSLTERDSDPDDPTEGQSVIWQSDGTGTGSDGDLLYKSTADGETRTRYVSRGQLIATGVAATDTSALQAALTAASDGDVLELIGDFVVNDTLTLTSQDGITITAKGCSITQAATAKATLKATTCDRLQIREIKFVGLGTEDPWSGTSWNTVAGVWLVACTNSCVESCSLTNHAGSGIVFQGACSNIRLAGNTVIGMGSPTIESNDNGSDGGISTGTGVAECSNIVIVNNDISGHAFGTIISATGSGLLYSGNTVHDIPGQHGMYYTGAMDGSISGNFFADCEKIGIKYQETTASVNAALSITGNTIVRSGADGIGVAGLASSGYYIENLTITGNNVYNCGQDGLNLGSVKGVTCTGNLFKTTSRYGVYLSYSSGVLSSNQVRDTEKNGIQIGPLAYPGAIIINGLELVDCCRNTAEGTTTTTDLTIAMLNAASAADTIYLGNVCICWEDYAAKTGTGALVNAIYSAVGTVQFTGTIYNGSGVKHRLDGTTAGLGRLLQPAPTAIADDDTALTAANIQTRLLTMASSTSGRAPTVPTGTAMNGIASIGDAIDWTFINTGDQIVTITAATGHTLVGDMTLAAGESGSFRTRVSAANTAITYRL